MGNLNFGLYKCKPFSIKRVSHALPQQKLSVSYIDVQWILFSWILFQFNTITIFHLVLFVVNKYLMVFIPFQCLKQTYLYIIDSFYMHSTAAMILCETCEVGFCERGAWSTHGCKIYSDTHVQVSNHFQLSTRWHDSVERSKGYQYWDIFFMIIIFEREIY